MKTQKKMSIIEKKKTNECVYLVEWIMYFVELNTSVAFN